MERHHRAATATWTGPSARADAPARPRARRCTEERLGAYAVKALLGEGGMARVYLGEHTGTGRRVAIKRLLPELALLPEAHALLLREARTAAAIRHPSLLAVHEFAYDPAGRPYFVMELAAGPTVAERLEDGPLPVAEALAIAIAVTAAIARVHRAGFLHRDVKADNVVLARRDDRTVPTLIDFGIACPIHAAAGDRPEGVAGTPQVMAPEQVALDRLDARTDVWGIGVLLHEMLAGELPFAPGATARDGMLAILSEPPRRLPAHVPAELAAIVAACLGKDPDGRPADAVALGRALRAVEARLRDEPRAAARAAA